MRISDGPRRRLRALTRPGGRRLVGWCAAAGLSALALWSLLAGVDAWAAADARVTSSLAAAPQSSYLYRFDPNTLTFFTRTLSTGGRPIDVAVTGTSPAHVWVTLAGANKIGHLVYTSTSQTAWTEVSITSTADSRPFHLALRGNEVWFTEQGANRVGRINALSGQVDEFFGNGLSPNSGLAGIDVAPDGSVWLAGRSSNRLVRLVVTDTNHFAFTEYPLGATSGPFDIAVESNSRIHFTAPISNRVGFLIPSTGSVVIANGIQNEPTRIVWDPANNATWFTEPRGNEVGLFFMGTLGIPAQFGPIVRPMGISDVSGNILWVTQQDLAGRLARLTYTYPSSVTVNSYDLPAAGLYPMGVARAVDGGVWLAAYGPDRLSLPLVMRNWAP